ncbi:DUF3348 family protein [Azospira restricta]|uniref:DUF3348 family protein n=1 Tax=Azospira restricta TaxID=404405 RepID=A0A974SNJ9_9RHOO|nr:DUF3348 family protein [Azospira restricta]QRJ63083.1 DUF3348 family protein [Azospira restricta]
MNTFLPRTGFNRPPLVRFLAGLTIAEVPESKQFLAERLGQWLELSDAIALSGALAAGAADAAGARPPAGGALADEVARVRAALAAAIAADTADGAGQPGRPRVRLPVPGPGATLATAADFLPYRRYYVAHQRDMEAAIGPLRARARALLAARSPALAGLAALDAALEQALAERERQQLGAVPFLLEKHFKRLHEAQRQAVAASPPGDDPARWLQPGGWLARFCGDLRQLLHAELELRLQPLLGLVEAGGGDAAAAAF